MAKITAKAQRLFEEALERANPPGPPRPPLALDVDGYGRAELWGDMRDLKNILEALAEITGEPLHQIVAISQVEKLKREYEEDSGYWEDVTPPEIDAWHWPELERSFHAGRSPAKNRRRGSKRGKR